MARRRVYIGPLQGVSANALTGIGLALPIITIITAFANLFGMGGAPLCSIARGSHEEEKAEKVMGNSFSMLLFTGGLLMGICLIFRKTLLYLFGASSATFPYANAYISIYLCGTVFVMISLGMNQFINSQGFGKIGMLTVMLGAFTNIVLDPILIFGLDMEYRSSSCNGDLRVITCSQTMMRKFPTGRKRFFDSKEQSIWSGSLVKEIIFLGTSGFVMSVTNRVVTDVCNATLQRYGGDIYVGIMTVINSVREIVTMPVTGLTAASQPVIGYNYGAGCYQRVKSAIRFTAVGCIVFTTVVWAVLFLEPRFFLQMFTKEPGILQYGVSAMRIYFCGIFMMALQFAGQSTAVALNRAKQAVFFSLFRKVIIVIPLTMLLPMIGNLGTDGVFWAEPISNVIGGTACFVTMLLTIWPKLREGSCCSQ
ncbi:MAG: MATE family efflux transporter [Mediterraneibacter gnavus]